MYNLKDYEDRLKEKASWVSTESTKEKGGLRTDYLGEETTKAWEEDREISSFMIYFLLSHGKDEKPTVRSSRCYGKWGETLSLE